MPIHPPVGMTKIISTSSLAFPQNGLDCTMVIGPFLELKLAFLVSTTGPCGSLEAEGVKYSQSVFWVIRLKLTVLRKLD